MRVKGRLTCARCCAYYPSTAILKCDNTILGISLTMCVPCHKRLHPSCADHTTAVRAEDMLCDRCLLQDATVVCPQCLGPSNCAQLCDLCSTDMHSDQRSSHLDHIKPMPSLQC